MKSPAKKAAAKAFSHSRAFTAALKPLRHPKTGFLSDLF